MVSHMHMSAGTITHLYGLVTCMYSRNITVIEYHMHIIILYTQKSIQEC